MSTNRNKFVLVILLALLQCFAPLLHAHAHGQSVAGGVHMHGDVDRLFADTASPGTPNLLAERVDAPVVAMAREYRQDSAIALSDADHPAPAISSPLSSFFQQPFLAVFVSPSLPCGLLSYSRPFSQAPPRP